MCAQRSSLLHYGSVSKLCRTARSSRSVRHDIHGIHGVHGTAFTECTARHSQSAQHWVCVSGGSHMVGVSEFHSVRLKTMKFNWLYLVILEQANRSRCTAKWREHWQTDTDTPVGTSQTTQPATQLVNVYDTCVCVFDRWQAKHQASEKSRLSKLKWISKYMYVIIITGIMIKRKKSHLYSIICTSWEMLFVVRWTELVQQQQ